MIDEARIKIWNGLKKHWGSIQTVVDRTTELTPDGYSRSYVFQVLAGTRHKVEILNLAADVLKEYEDNHARQLNRLQKVSQELAATA